MIRAYKFLLRPTVRQDQALSEMLADHCSLYNSALQERRDAYRHVSKTSVAYGMQSAQLKDIRAFDPERQGRWSFSSQQATLRRLDKAFAAFFRRTKAGDTPGYPRFRGVNWFDTVDFPRNGDGCRWDSTPHDPVTRVRFQGVGHVKVNQHRPVTGKVKTVSIKREGRRWYVILTAEQTAPEPLPKTGSVAGIDLGIANFLADSGGGFVPNPRHGRKAATKLEAAQQALARFPRVRRDKRTANHQRAVNKVAGLLKLPREETEREWVLVPGLVLSRVPRTVVGTLVARFRSASGANGSCPRSGNAGAGSLAPRAARYGLDSPLPHRITHGAMGAVPSDAGSGIPGRAFRSPRRQRRAAWASCSWR
ncbi:transposase [Streptomyces sp. NPDC042207]|uniref:RNA-guided endonuclease InsQ/TnpB family protein n=1 Tax=Streptomyces sp. NPDC042207 TaxID=3154331 RepID=UPI0033C8636B